MKTKKLKPAHVASRVVLTLTISLCSYFSMNISKAEDPWTTLDKKFAHSSLCEAFLDGKSYPVKRETRSALGIDKWNYEIKTFCSQNRDGYPVARVEFWKDKKIFSRNQWTLEQWNQFQGNLLKNKANGAAQLGQAFKLDKVATVGKFLRADYSVYSNNTQLAETGYWIIGDGPIIQQIIERTSIRHSFIEEESKDTLLK